MDYEGILFDSSIGVTSFIQCSQISLCKCQGVSCNQCFSAFWMLHPTGHYFVLDCSPTIVKSKIFFQEVYCYNYVHFNSQCRITFETSCLLADCQISLVGHTPTVEKNSFRIVMYNRNVPGLLFFYC